MHPQKKLIVTAVLALCIGIAVGYAAFGDSHHGHLHGTHQKGQQSSMQAEMDHMMMQLDGKTGSEFDAAFLEEMIVHHEGAVHMAEAALLHAESAEIKNLARAIIAAQMQEIEQMRTWQRDGFSKEPVATESLSDARWVWRESIIGGDAVFAPQKKGAFSITFNTDGTLNGTTDCNSFFGEYTRINDVVTVGPLGMTKMFCEGSEESAFTSALTEGPFTISFEGSNALVLRFSEVTAMYFDRAQ